MRNLRNHFDRYAAGRIRPEKRATCCKGQADRGTERKVGGGQLGVGDGIGRMLDFLEEHLPERLRPLLEKARELLPDPEIGQQQEQQQHQRGMGGMEL